MYEYGSETMFVSCYQLAEIYLLVKHYISTNGTSARMKSCFRLELEDIYSILQIIFSGDVNVTEVAERLQCVKEQAHCTLLDKEGEIPSLKKFLHKVYKKIKHLVKRIIERIYKETVYWKGLERLKQLDEHFYFTSIMELYLQSIQDGVPKDLSKSDRLKQLDEHFYSTSIMKLDLQSRQNCVSKDLSKLERLKQLGEHFYSTSITKLDVQSIQNGVPKDLSKLERLKQLDEHFYSTSIMKLDLQSRQNGVSKDLSKKENLVKNFQHWPTAKGNRKHPKMDNLMSQSNDATDHVQIREWSMNSGTRTSTEVKTTNITPPVVLQFECYKNENNQQVIGICEQNTRSGEIMKSEIVLKSYLIEQVCSNQNPDATLNNRTSILKDIQMDEMLHKVSEHFVLINNVTDLSVLSSICLYVMRQDILTHFGKDVVTFYSDPDNNDQTILLQALVTINGRKTVLHSRFHMVTEEIFQNAVTRTATSIYYTTIVPRDGRLNQYIPVLCHSYIHWKDMINNESETNYPGTNNWNNITVFSGFKEHR